MSSSGSGDRWGCAAAAARPMSSIAGSPPPRPAPPGWWRRRAEPLGSGRRVSRLRDQQVYAEKAPEWSIFRATFSADAFPHSIHLCIVAGCDGTPPCTSSCRRDGQPCPQLLGALCRSRPLLCRTGRRTCCQGSRLRGGRPAAGRVEEADRGALRGGRSEEHTSELQSRGHLVCRLLLEKEKAWIPRLLLRLCH